MIQCDKLAIMRSNRLSKRFWIMALIWIQFKFFYEYDKIFSDFMDNSFQYDKIVTESRIMEIVTNKTNFRLLLRC